MKLVFLCLIIVAYVHSAPKPDEPLLAFKNGNFRVSFGGYTAEAGLGGLLTGNSAHGGLHASAGTPWGPAAAAGLGGGVAGDGLAGGGLYAGATAGGGLSANAGLSGSTHASGGSSVHTSYESEVHNVPHSVVETTITKEVEVPQHETYITKEVTVPQHETVVSYKQGQNSQTDLIDTRYGVEAPKHETVVETTKVVSQPQPVHTFRKEVSFNSQYGSGELHKEIRVPKQEAFVETVVSQPAQNTFRKEVSINSQYLPAAELEVPKQKTVVETTNVVSQPAQQTTFRKEFAFNARFGPQPVEHKEEVVAVAAPPKQETYVETTKVVSQPVQTYRKEVKIDTRYEAPQVQKYKIVEKSVQRPAVNRVNIRKEFHVKSRVRPAIRKEIVYHKYASPWFGGFSAGAGINGGAGASYGGVAGASASTGGGGASYATRYSDVGSSSGTGGYHYSSNYHTTGTDLFNSIFNIPIQTLKAVNQLVNNVAGGGTLSVNKEIHVN